MQGGLVDYAWRVTTGQFLRIILNLQKMYKWNESKK